MNGNTKPILFFDGLCGLCNKSINFIISIDKKDRLLFAPLQGKIASKLLGKSHVIDLDSMVFYDNGKVYTKSTAVLKSIIAIGGLWKVLAVLLILPPFLRDIIYNIVAKSRYKWFGKLDACRLPTSEEKNKILI